MAGTELEDAATRVRAAGELAREVLEELTDEELNRRPAPVRWSVGECFVHMNRTNRGYLDAIEPAVREARAKGRLAAGPFRYGWFEEWFVRQMSPPVRRRFKAPKPFAPVVSGTRVDPGEVREFFALLDRLEAAMAEADGVDLAAVKVPSPASRLIRFRLGPAFRLLVGHTERHLIQARGAREAILKEAS